MSETQVRASRRRRRGSLTRERIVTAAFALASDRGLGDFTMADLAAYLDVGVTGLYWHFRTKDELIRAMSIPAMTQLDEMMIRPDDDAASADWADYLRRYFRRLRAAYAEHPVLADIMLMRPAPHDPEAIAIAYRSIDEVTAHLVAAGFAPTSAWYLYSTALRFTQSTVSSERVNDQYRDPMPWPETSDGLRAQGWSTLAGLSDGRSIAMDMTGDAAFDAGLNIILAGASPG
ncbi:helix-turn-helix domain-containing protein [Gordonia sp. ABSL1-1]|uniref:TetR/AcrR family transcriptional regulator n=1 Tax=Gordonia sp. ABSL1-1 TaxID=3053923 RepID=UPI0025730B51|nr:TetR/AcrR family transcriptional regulator [Gordonia sp. ABSL1-1]MDL9935957.1 helix-turn-helix domain-containing protein [Gordonia sp. ABSL1-1]